MGRTSVNETHTPRAAGAAALNWTRGFWQRARNRAIDVASNPTARVVAGVVVAALLIAFIAGWVATSRMIDRQMSGGLLGARAGVYSAPLIVRVGQPATPEDLVSYLQELGYGSAAEATEGFPGRYAIDGSRLVVEPQGAAPASAFQALAITFANGSIKKIEDAATGKPLKEGLLEPLMLASLGRTREKRITVDYEAIPEHLRGAVIATEDRRFWKHHGVDYVGIARAVRKNVDEGGVVQGGSTITQQLVKNVFLSPERTFTRKLKEAWVAWVLEWKLSKEQIFALYCNEVYLGQSGTYAVHGFAEASRRYFGKDLSTLTLDESALLAGLIHAPNTHSPYKHPDRAKARRDLVLDKMAETGAITREQADAAKQVPIRVVPPTRDSEWLDAPYFNDYVQAYLEEVFDGEVPSSGSFTVNTSLDINLQRAATEVVNAQLAQLDKVFGKKVPAGTVQASLVAVDPKTGQVLAMVGGRDYGKSQFNRTTDALRQPGSVFKPIVYAAALSTGRFTASTPLMDAPQVFKFANGRTYEPGNFGDSYANRELPVRVAFKHSKNVPTVELALRTGLGTIASLAERAGLPRPKEYPSMALGVAEATPLQVAEAYTAFANKGDAVEPTPIASAEGVEVPQPSRRSVFSPAVAAVMTSMMEDVVNGGTGAAVRARGFKGAAAGKTGTSRDGWFAGYTPNLVCVVWVGFDDGSQLGLTGAESALPIWTEFMKRAVAVRPELGGNGFPRPSGLEQATVCDESGQIASIGCPATHTELFVAGTAPAAECYLHSGLYAGSPYVDDLELGDVELPEDVIDDSDVRGADESDDDEREIIEPGTAQPSYRPEPPERPEGDGRRDRDEDDEPAARPDGVQRLRPTRPPARIEVPRAPADENSGET